MTFDTTARTAAGMTSVSKLLQARVGDEGEPHRRHRRFSTSLYALDEALGGGVRCRDLVLIGGGPGAGKTTMALQWARAIAMQGARCFYVAYGHTDADLLDRCTALEEGSSEFYGNRLHLVAAGRYSGIDAIESLLPDRASRDTVLFVDHLQRISTRGTHFASDDDRVGYLAESLKDIALRRNVTVVALSAVDKDALSKPRVGMQHVCGSSAVLYEADVVLMLNKSGTCSATDGTRDGDRRALATRNVVVSVEKNRNGASGVDLELVADFAHFAFRPEATFAVQPVVDDLLIVE